MFALRKKPAPLSAERVCALELANDLRERTQTVAVGDECVRHQILVNTARHLQEGDDVFCLWKRLDTLLGCDGVADQPTLEEIRAACLRHWPVTA